MADPVLLEKICLYSHLAEKTIASQVVKCQALQAELDLCRRRLNEKDERVSQFMLERLQSGGIMKLSFGPESAKGFKSHLERALNVLKLDTNGVETVYEVLLQTSDPCPSPEKLKKSWEAGAEVDLALTMCDIWARVAEVELQCKKAARRQAMQRHNNVKRLVCRAFGSSDIPTDSTLFRAACGFVEGSQEQYHHCDEGELRLGCNILKRLDKNEEAVRATRCMEKQRKELLTQMVTFMFEGEVALDIEKTVLRKKRFSTVKLARVSDMSSSFNPSALGAIASCEGGKGHGEMGLLCGESTLRRCLSQVLSLGLDLGFYSLPEGNDGNVWCWGDATGPFTRAVNLYVKSIYCDACCDSVTASDPWIVPLTGDAARTSQRGTVVTVLGPKMADHRLSNQQRSMKTMYQGSEMYTPACAGYATENELMEYFHLLLKEFGKIEAQGFCLVHGKNYPVHIKVVVIADMSFLHKYVQRGGGSHSATCFCLFCGALRNFRHHGYPGGCRKCRALGIVYDNDGIQQCTHYEACTVEFLEWQGQRYVELSRLVPEFPLTSLPAWEDVAQLRRECLKRCVGRWSGWRPKIEKCGKGQMTGADLSDWIMRYTRDDATLSHSIDTGVMYCPIKIVIASLAARKIIANSRGVGKGIHLRLQLRSIIQLEQEYTRMTMHMRDQRFTPSHVSAKAVPIERLLICVLHCPMRTHEKVITLLLQQACQNRLPNKSVPILNEIVVILRSLGKLKDAWTYEWISGAKCVSKVKLHWDQSKRIFSEDNMVSLIAIIRLAIRTDEQVYWITFMAQYIKLIDLMTVSRDYSDEDIDLLEVYCDTTYRLLISHCGGQAAVSNYFHYIGSGHLVWMCRAYGNIWRYRNEGVEAFNKCLSKRTNMFNSHGNRGNITDVGIVEPFEVMGKWMARYAMWQLDLANQLFIPKGSILGASEVKFDPQEEIWEYVSDHESDDDDDYSITSVSSGSHSESDVDDFLPEDVPQCVYTENEDEVRRYSMRKRLLPK